jgi:hypothetical protein
VWPGSKAEPRHADRELRETPPLVLALGEEVAAITHAVELLSSQLPQTDLDRTLVVQVVSQLRAVTLIMRDMFASIVRCA